MINRLLYEKYINDIKGKFVLDVLRIETLIENYDEKELEFIKKEYQAKLNSLSGNIKFPSKLNANDIKLHKLIFREEIELLEYLIKHLTIYIRMIYMPKVRTPEVFSKQRLIDKIDKFKRECDFHYFNYEMRCLC